MRYLRYALLGLLAVAVLAMGVAASAGSGGQRQTALAQGTLVGPQRVVVKDLPVVPAALATAQKQVVIPRRAPELGTRGYAPPVPSANAVDTAGEPELQPLAAPDILTSFDGLDSTDNPFGLTPPDPQIAVGPSHIVEFVNVVGRITDKSGVPAVADFSLDDFFGVFPGAASTDPKIIYDDIHDRFFASYIDIDFAFGIGDLFLAISQTSDPTGAWNVYLTSFPGAIPDYPGIGVTNDKFTISYNLFDMVSGSFIGEQTAVVQKSDVLAGVSAGFVLSAVNASRFTVRPAQNLSPADDQYLTTFDITGGLPATEMTVIKITGTPNASNVVEASVVNLPIISQDIPPPSISAGPGTIDSGDWRMLEAVWRDNSLWSSASAACIPPSDTDVRSCVHLIEVETVGAPSVVQDIMFGGLFEYLSWPAIRTDSSGNLYVSLTGTHAGVFPTAKVAGRLASDPLGTMSGTCQLKAGEIEHLTSRWGDYLGAAVDPADPSKVWVVGEYAKNDGAMRWGTYIGSLSYTVSGVCPAQPTPIPPPTPANDDFVDAIVIPEPLPYTNSQSTVGATTEGGEPSPCGSIASTVWYMHTPTTSGTVTADTVGSGYDTVLAVYTGADVGSLALVGCNDNFSGLQSQVQFAATAGTTYQFQVGGFGGDIGDLLLNVNSPLPPPPCPPGGNDGFEAGVVDTNAIPCWTVVDQAGGSGSWCNQTGTVPPQGTCAGSVITVAAPPELLQAEMTNQSGPDSHVLYRCGFLASGPLSFQLYINNEAGVFFSPPSLDYTFGPNQQFRADLVTAAGIAADPFTVAPGDILRNIYQTLPGDAAVSGYSLVSADASAYVGQEVCLRFAEVDNQFFFHAGVDDVSVSLGLLDSDGDGVYDADEGACGADPFDANKRPERVDGIFAGVDDDGDTLIDEALPGGSAGFDCDGDGWTGTQEQAIFSAANTANDQDPCGNDGWPADLDPNNFLNIGDKNSYTVPAGPDDGHGVFNYFGHTAPDVDTNGGPDDSRPNAERWDIEPTGVISIGDLNSLTAPASKTARPPMFLGGIAYLTDVDGPGPLLQGECPWPS